jgi:hypothetical protein
MLARASFWGAMLADDVMWIRKCSMQETFPVLSLLKLLPSEEDRLTMGRGTQIASWKTE